MHLSPQGHVETSAPLVLWLDRHVARTGGRSTHQLIARLRRQALLFHREALVLGGSVAYEHTASQWRELIRAAGQCSSARSSSLLVAAQSNAPDFGTAWLPIVRELRSMGNRSRCIEKASRASLALQAVLSVRVREPLQHYLSAYTWATHAKPGKGLSKVRARADLAVTNHSKTRQSAPLDQEAWHARTPIPSFLAWSAAAPNLQASTFPCHQSRAFLYGGADAFVTAEITGEPHRDSKANPLPPEVSEADLPTIVRMLEEDFNVVTPLRAALSCPSFSGGKGAQGSAAWPLFSSMIEVRSSVCSPEPREQQLCEKNCGYTEAARDKAHEEACPDMNACAEHIRKVAPLDVKLFEHSARIWSERTLTRPVANKEISASSGSLSAIPQRMLTATSGLSKRCASFDLLPSAASPKTLLQEDCRRLRGFKLDHKLNAALVRLARSPRRCCACAHIMITPPLQARFLGLPSPCGAPSTIGVSGKYVVQGGRQGADKMARLHARLPRHGRHRLTTFSIALSGGGGLQSSSPKNAIRRLLYLNRDRHSNPGVAIGTRLAAWLHAGEVTCRRELPDLRYLMDKADEACGEVRLTFAFSVEGGSKMRLPAIDWSACNIAFSDNRTIFAAGYASPAQQRAAATHVIKVMSEEPPAVLAPLLFPRSHSVLWGDIKCVDSSGRYPCSAIRAPVGSDLLVPMNPWYRSRSIEGEFVATWQHMRARHKTMQAS
ncbi:MAG: hypothetical protein SGPRY_000841 [Prymnesium sp.]